MERNTEAFGEENPETFNRLKEFLDRAQIKYSLLEVCYNIIYNMISMPLRKLVKRQL